MTFTARRAADCYGAAHVTDCPHRRRTIYDARKARLKELIEGLLAEYPNVSTKEVAAFLARHPEKHRELFALLLEERLDRERLLLKRPN